MILYVHSREALLKLDSVKFFGRMRSETGERELGGALPTTLESAVSDSQRDGSYLANNMESQDFEVPLMALIEADAVASLQPPPGHMYLLRFCT